jgi:hypothetical protein
MPDQVRHDKMESWNPAPEAEQASTADNDDTAKCSQHLSMKRLKFIIILLLS